MNQPDKPTSAKSKESELTTAPVISTKKLPGLNELVPPEMKLNIP